MELLIKYCINSFSHVDESFDRKLINFLQNCSTSLLFVSDWSVRSEVKSNPRLRKRWRLYIFPVMQCGPKSLRKQMGFF